MCGLFGFAGTSLHDRDTLALAASLAARRGPDGWGMLVDGQRTAGLGRLPPSAVPDLPPCRSVLGHARLATVMGPRVDAACHPIIVGRYAVTHNGTISNAHDLALEFGLALTTGVDSEIIAHLLNHDPSLTAVMSIADHGGHFAVAALDMETGSVELLAKGLPLWTLSTPEGRYWCSVRPNLDWEQSA